MLPLGSALAGWREVVLLGGECVPPLLLPLALVLVLASLAAEGRGQAGRCVGSWIDCTSDPRVAIHGFEMVGFTVKYLYSSIGIDLEAGRVLNLVNTHAVSGSIDGQPGLAVACGHL